MKSSGVTLDAQFYVINLLMLIDIELKLFCFLGWELLTDSVEIFFDSKCHNYLDCYFLHSREIYLRCSLAWP